MGFSVSGSTAVIFLGLFISFGIAYTAADNGMERVNEAYDANTEDALARQNTAIAIGNASVANEGGQLYVDVTVDNTGSTTLSIDDTDILIGGNYTNHTSSKMETFEVAGTGETDIWLPGETLRFRFNVSVASPPDRVKVVTGPGVSDSEVV
jgi:flagellar protein FlaF